VPVLPALTSPEPVSVQLHLYSNWGIELLSSTIDLEGDEVRTVNLGHWIVDGKMYDKTLSEGDLKHLQAALSGQRSPNSSML